MGMSDEVLLNHLNGHPELRIRVESMLLVVVDEKGNGVRHMNARAAYNINIEGC